MTRRAGLARTAAIVAAVLGALAGPARAADPVPTPALRPITGGVHGLPWMGVPFRARDYGYSEREYFVSGTARAYGTSDAPAPYVTRILVYRPLRSHRFSGNVDVEWDNVTLQADFPADFMWLYPQVMARGDAYVEVTAQQAGVCGLGLTSAAGVCNPLSVKGYDAQRYAPLVHPGDQYAFDIFSQVGQALRHPAGVSPLGRLRVRRMIGIGESQSGAELDNYMRNGADAAAKVYDGFLVDADAHFPRAGSFRVPTMHLWGEESAQPDAATTEPNDTVWEVAGAGHTDYWVVQGLAARMAHNLGLAAPLTRAQETAARQANGDYGQQGPGSSATCAGNSQFPRRYVMDAMLSDLQTWVRTGRRPPSAPSLEFSGAGELLQQAPPAGAFPLLPLEGDNAAALGLSPLALDHDANGNAIGGLRLPVISVPVAAYTGAVCVLLGTSVPLLPATLSALYPTHADYVAKMMDATQASVRQRFMTRRDGQDLLRRACASAIPAWGITARADQPGTCRHIKRRLRAS